MLHCQCFHFLPPPIISAAIVLIIILLQPDLNDIIFQSNESVLKFAAYWLSLVYVGPMAGGCILAAVIGSSLSRKSYNVDDTDRGLEARFSESFNMTASNPLQQPNNTVTMTDMNLNSSYPPGNSLPQPITDEPDESDPPQLVGSVLSSYHDVTSLPPRHTESSLLLTGARSSDYPTT